MRYSHIAIALQIFALTHLTLCFQNGAKYWRVASQFRTIRTTASFQLSRRNQKRVTNDYMQRVRTRSPIVNGLETFADTDSGSETSTESVDPLKRFTFNDIFSPRGIDAASVSRVLIGEAIVLLVGVISCTVIGYNPLQLPAPCSFDAPDMLIAMRIAVPLSAGAALLDSLPIDFFRETARDTRIFATRMIGRRSKFPQAFGVALLMASAAAFAEEFTFRGALYTAVQYWFGSSAAFVASSLLFGLCHTLTFGPNALLEALFGAVFTYSFIASGGNLAVPIAVHTLYDIFTLLLCWGLGTKEFNAKLRAAKKQLDAGQPQPKSLPDQFDVHTRATFNAMDINKDGVISEEEFISSTRLYGVGLLPLNAGVEVARQAFKRTDVNEDGSIDYEEFTLAFRQTLNAWLRREVIETSN